MNNAHKLACEMEGRSPSRDPPEEKPTSFGQISADRPERWSIPESEEEEGDLREERVLGEE